MLKRYKIGGRKICYDGDVVRLEAECAALLEALKALYNTAGWPKYSDEIRAHKLTRAALASARGQEVKP